MCLNSAVPDVEVKGESGHYFLLVQGSDSAGRGTCKVRMLHSDNQINGAAAMATISALLRDKSSTGKLSLYFSCTFYSLCTLEEG